MHAGLRHLLETRGAAANSLDGLRNELLVLAPDIALQRGYLRTANSSTKQSKREKETA
jgi:hypothetical protein